MIITWNKHDQHLPPTFRRLRVGDQYDTEDLGVTDAEAIVWIAEGYASLASPPSLRYRIKADLCVDCAACLEVCPLGAITADPYAIDLELCNGCGDCATTCPVEAIEQYEWEPPGMAAAKSDKPKKTKKIRRP